MPTKTKVLFICVHNSARSQMAEAFLNQIAGDRYVACSAGLEPGQLNPFAVKVMREAGIDISNHQTKSVQDILKKEKTFDIVVTVCDEASAGRCPVIPGKGERLHWSFEDPGSVQGTDEAKLTKAREVRDQIQQRIKEWLRTLREG